MSEIGRPKEVEAARAIKQRGVRIIGSAYGNLRSALKDRDLQVLLGGVDVVTLGDAAASEESGETLNASKIKAKRRGKPIFDVIVELRRGQPHEWQVILSTANAVDKVLEGKENNVQRRVHNVDGGNLRLVLVSR